MIVFLNFAPIRFMGGAERWQIDMATAVSKHEETLLVSVASSLASIYGRLVLKRSFTDRITREEEQFLPPNLSLTLSSFIPLTASWRLARQAFRTSRMIYTRFELLEVSIIIYFVGISGLKKTVAGVHSPLYYPTPISFTDRLHKWVYESSVCRWVLSHMKKVQLVSRTDEAFVKKSFALTNMVYIPNAIVMRGIKVGDKRNQKMLRVIFVGELSIRKGADILRDLIPLIPNYMHLDIVGDGPMRGEIEQAAAARHTTTVHGYLTTKKIQSLYKQSDVFLLPSRGEGLSLAMLEALAHGLYILDSQDITVGMDSSVEMSCEGHDADRYMMLLDRIQSKRLNKQHIHEYCKEHFSMEIIRKRLMKEIFEITT